MRIIQVSDTHLSDRHRHFATNTAATARWIAAQRPALIVHTGDVTMDGAGAPNELVQAKSWPGFAGVDVLSVPGNHDVGDAVAVNPRQPVNDARLAAWRQSIGPDWWRRDTQGWRLIGLNAMLLGTGHAEEEVQFSWLKGALACALPIAMFLHKPLFVDHPGEGPRGYWTVTPEPRARIFALMKGANVRMVASGHLHIWRQVEHEGASYVWGPAASFVVGASQEPLGGERRLGVVQHDFAANAVTSRFIRPEGLEDLLIEPVQHLIYPPAAPESGAPV
jgi:alkaline phosphatase D